MANFVTFCVFHIIDFRQMIALVFKLNFLKGKNVLEVKNKIRVASL